MIVTNIKVSMKRDRELQLSPTIYNMSIIKLDLSRNKSQMYSVFVNMPFEVKMYRVTYYTIS